MLLPRVRKVSTTLPGRTNAPASLGIARPLGRALACTGSLPLGDHVRVILGAGTTIPSRERIVRAAGCVAFAVRTLVALQRCWPLNLKPPPLALPRFCRPHRWPGWGQCRPWWRVLLEVALAIPSTVAVSSAVAVSCTVAVSATVTVTVYSGSALLPVPWVKPSAGLTLAFPLSLAFVEDRFGRGGILRGRRFASFLLERTVLSNQ
mmetsp:Transcript_51157/g.141693  ORF Transcript_51157/g.141693 Transcript_51157/m.141693 type:complete len:206 (+) Transcript_51157:159-776(+)